MAIAPIAAAILRLSMLLLQPRRTARAALSVPVGSDGEVVLSLPDQADSLALQGEGLHRGGRQVLLGDDELGAGDECNVEAGVGPQVDDLADMAERRNLVRTDRYVRLGQADLLRS